MGDRANIVIRSKGEQVCLYSHWDGSSLGESLKTSLRRAKSRLQDFQYLTRIVFCDMVKGYENDLTGYGITQNIHDGERNIFIVDVGTQTVLREGVTKTFEEYIKD